MFINTLHVDDQRRILLYNGELILEYCKGIISKFRKQKESPFNKSVLGELYLTTHRLIFVSTSDFSLKSFCIPFCCMINVKLAQPIFTSNYLTGYSTIQNGNNYGEDVEWVLLFNKGGCIDIGRTLLKAVTVVHSLRPLNAPPTYESDSQKSPTTSRQFMSSSNFHHFASLNRSSTHIPSADNVLIMDAPPPYLGVNDTRNSTHRRMEWLCESKSAPRLPTYEECKSNNPKRPRKQY
uniref:GRAM domain-containing protein n=1 Tax=Rhabditophanes sp. KR3021 TaxID=114890 RepID=A0AC35TVU7_9BILA